MEVASSRHVSPGAGAPDPLRDSFVRYIAFLSDVGEAFKPFISRRLYLGSYAVVALYGAVDTVDKGRRAYLRAAAARQCSTTPLPAIAAAALGGQTTTVPASAAAPALAASLAQLQPPGAAALRQSASGMVAACAACLPPAAAYHPAAAAASSISERPSLAVPVAAAVLDTALWHGVASLAIPAGLINRTVWGMSQLLSRGAFSALHPRLRVGVPSAAGLALIPLAVPHIDEAVTEWFDAHLRPHLPPEARA